MREISKLLVIVGIMSCALLSCSKSDDQEQEEWIEDPGENNNDDEEVVYMLLKPQPIQLTEAQKTFASDNNQFTLNFLNTVNQFDRSGKSFVYSPLSITYVLGMVNDAATGQTEQELEQTLGFHEGGIQAVNDYCKKLNEELPRVDSYVHLDIANAIFLNKEFALKEQFQKDMQLYYDAKAEALDFSSPKTLSYINSWCNEKTKGMIPTILDQISPKAVSYLLNAIYFNADWASKFDEKNTKTEDFTTESGKTQLPMMHQKVHIAYQKTDSYSAVIMPYGSGLWNMTVLLPEEGKTTDDIIKEVTQTNSAVLNHREGGDNGHFEAYEVDLKLPRFETASDTNELGDNGLIDVLSQMGIITAFDRNSAEIPNMTYGGVYISMMRQKAAIKVNEKGAEAAAVTVAAMDLNAIGPTDIPKASFHANRPFVYIIRESSSGVILFVGKYTGL